MTLEDFFTLTEMKDGLAVPSRVHELIAVMQKEKDCAVKNIGDATRQWAAVASTIAATENKDCLDLFIQLDGLCFIDRWLKDAQKFSNDTNDGFVEESIAALLRALEKLQVDKERSMSSGICITVNNLLDHNCSRIRDRAKALFDGWKEGIFSDKICEHIQGNGEFHGGELSCQSSRRECAVDFRPAKSSSDGDNNVAEPTIDDTLQLRDINSLQPEKAEDVPAQPLITEIPSNTILDTKHAEDRLPGSIITSVVSISIQESVSLKEKATLISLEGNSSVDIQNISVPKQKNAEPKLDSQKQPSSFQGRMGLVASASGKMEAGVTTSAQEIAHTTLQNNADAKEGDFCLNPTAFCDGEMSASAPEVGTDDLEAAYHFNMQLSKSTTKDGLCLSDGLQDLSGTETRSEKPNELGSTLSQMRDTGTADNDREDRDDGRGLCSDGDEDMRDGSDFSKPAMDCRIPNLIDMKKSDIEIEYGIVDPLEVARQVAQEVEREVIDCREPSCSSSSEKILKGGDKQPGSPDSVSEEKELYSVFSPDEMVTRKNHPTEADAVGEGCSINSDNLDTLAENGMQELESSQVTELAKEQDVNAEKGLCDFDLNQEVSSDDVELPINSTVTPVSVVSASRPAAASGSPAAPLQFEGTLGWKGSAATSAFRPASPRKASDSDKALETGSSSYKSKQRQDCLDIDLNVAGGGDEKFIGVVLERKKPVPSGLQYGDSSLEVGTRKSHRPSLDLNRISDDEAAAPSDLRMEGQLYYPWNGRRSPSPALSSSSMQLPMRNFDLNDRPLYANEFSDQGLYHGKLSQIPSSHGGSRPADPVISIMGKRVEVGNGVDGGRKDWIPQMLSLPHGKPLEPALDANIVRMGNFFGVVPPASYTHSPAFAYNGFTSAAPMSITTAMYGPGSSIPYMVDSKGAPVMPQIMGSASAVSPYPPPPFVMNMTSETVGLGVVGSSRPNFDLNSGFAIDGGRSIGGLRQFFMPSQGRSLEINSQPSSSTMVGGKRREPDGGREPYSLQNKHSQGPWR